MRTHPHFIKEWRKHGGLSQEKFAERIGIERSYLSKIESGKRRYDQPFLEAAAETLQCTPADLIMRNPADPVGMDLWAIWSHAEPGQRLRLSKSLEPSLARDQAVDD